MQARHASAGAGHTYAERLAMDWLLGVEQYMGDPMRDDLAELDEDQVLSLAYGRSVRAERETL